MQVLEQSEEFEPVRNIQNQIISLTGKISPEVGALYTKEKNIILFEPEYHDVVLRDLSPDNLFGINFANADGYDVNFAFAKYRIPFISGVTGADPEKESALVEAVKKTNIPAVIDKNMSPALVVFGKMLAYAAREFPGALEGFAGYGVDSHQTGKKDGISGTLVKWSDPIKGLGVDFKPIPGDRTSAYGHGDHFIRIASPDGQVKLTFQTEVLGRNTYAQGTIKKGLPFLARKDNEIDKGQVYSMADVLRG